MKKLKEVRDHLKTWLERHKKASEVAAEVQRTYDVVEWQYQMWSAAPKALQKFWEPTLQPVVQREWELAVRHLPQMPEYNVDVVTTVSTVATSGATISYDCLLTARDLAAIADPQYFDRQARSYQVIQSNQRRVEEVRDLTTRLFPKLSGQFDQARNSFDSARARAVSTAAAALEIRTLIDNSQGELLNKAKKHAKENMTWETMTARLCPDNIAPEQNATLNTQKQLRGQVIGRLSGIAKRKAGANVTELEHAWTQALDHLYVVFRAIKEAGRLTLMRPPPVKRENNP